MTQFLFDVGNVLHRLAFRTERAVPRSLILLVHRLLSPLFVRRGTAVCGHLYGRTLWMPAEHRLIPLLAEWPNLNRPLAAAARVLLPPDRPLSVIDVGANIGETVAVIEQLNSDRCVYFCVEADPLIAELCRRNHRGSKVIVRTAAVGDQTDVSVTMVDDGRASPSVRVGHGHGAQKLARLDDLAADFAEAHGLDLLKSDTEGCDFAVLRSATKLLERFHPAVFFEWYPALLATLGERPDDFSFLEELGYRHWVIFTHTGELYCEMSNPPHRMVEVLARVTDGRLPYFDVFGSVTPESCRALTEEWLRIRHIK